MTRTLPLLPGLALLFAPVAAQAIDCRLATTPVDKTVCASPALMARDAALNAAFAAAMARDPAQGQALLAAQRDWLRGRNRACGPMQGAALAACLDRSMAARIAALEPAAAPPQPVAAAPAPAPVPVAAAPSPLAEGPAVEGAAARLVPERVPAAGTGEAILTVTSPGRFTLRAESATGTALQLTDMLTGPGPWAGLPGAADGRLDLLLEAGTYRLRSQGADGATGEALLHATPFREAAPPVALPPGRRLDATLGDGEQRGAWVVVTERGALRIEAAGRSLAELALWRDGRDRVPLATEAAAIAPQPGHPLTRLLASPVLEAGSYLVTAYGGPARVWADGAGARPFHLRVGASRDFAEGWLAGRIGPLGSEVFAVPGQASDIRLDLPESAAARLEVLTGRARAEAALQPNSREPTAWLRPGRRGDQPRLVVVHGAEGQAFTLRGFGEGAGVPSRAGRYLLLAEFPGLGGDAPPPGALLTRREADHPPALLAGIGPHVGPGLGWRGRFTLAGPLRLAVLVTAPGPVALRAQGVAVTARLALGGGELAPPRADGGGTTLWDLPAGWHELRLEPQAGGSGILDLTIGPPGLAPAPVPPLPAGPVLPLGEQSLAEGQRFGFAGQGARLVARALPLDLGAAPLAVTLPPGEGLDLPLAPPPEGRLTAIALDGGAVEAGLLPGARLRVAPAPVARTLVLGWQRPEPPPPRPQPAPPETLPLLAIGTPLRLDLGREASREVRLRLEAGGLTRLESTGRLRVAGRLATRFLPALEEAEANGAGGNMLIQRPLRAGEYRLTVTARDSAGRLGLLARPAPLREAAALVPGGTARFALAAGEGLALPLAIAEPGLYRLELPGLGRSPRGRLEDAEGWPLMEAGEIGLVEQELRPGRYRLVVEPADVETRLVARLTRPAPAMATEGHGPHPLPFGAAVSQLWREPPPGAAREPDRWRFALAGPAAVTLSIGDGMGARLHRLDGETPGRVASFAGGADFQGELPAGAYEVQAEAIGRNDRLDYSLRLDSTELQPEAPRRVTLPASIPLALAENRVVSLSSFGGTALRAVLRDAAGREVARDEGGETDWNLALSRLLPAGRYTLALTALDAPPAAPQAGAEEDDSGEAEDTPEEAESAAASSSEIELRLALPPTLPPRPADLTGEMRLEGAGVHRLALPAIGPDSLLLVEAEAGQAVVLSLEAREADGRLRPLATARGQRPFLAVPGAAGEAWQLSAWAAEGGAVPIRLVLRAERPAAQPGPSLTPAPVEGMAGRFLALAGLPEGLAVALPGAPGLLAGALPGMPLGSAGLGLPRDRRLWVIAAAPAPVPLASLRPGPGAPLVLDLPAEAEARLPAAATPRLWIGSGGNAPPWMEAGRGMDAGAGSTLALAGDAPLRLRGGTMPARILLRALDPVLAPARAVGTEGLRITLAPGAAQPVTLPAGRKQLRLDLAPGLGVILGWRGGDAVTAWSGAAALSRRAEGEWEEALLVNAGDAPAPAALDLGPAGVVPLAVAPGRPLRLLPGAAESISLPVEAGPGQRLFWSGAEGGRFTGAAGEVAVAPGLALMGPGRLVLHHGIGPLLAWLEESGAGLFPGMAARPIALPSRTELAGEAMEFAVDPGGPALLHARTSAPVVLALGDAPPEAFAAGAELHRAIPGATRLRLIAAQPGPLGGVLELTATPVIEAGEGVGEPVMVPPGGAALFGFTLGREAMIGLGLRAEPDRVAVRLLDAAGRPLGEGVAQRRRLPPGRYLIEARVPADAPASQLRPALVGLQPRPDGPPPEIIRAYQSSSR